MKTRYLLSAMGLGWGLTVILLLLLAGLTPIVQANPAIYYVREGASGDGLDPTTPCSSILHAISLADPGHEIRVATGIYTENLIITRSLSLRGGWNNSFNTQNSITYPTIVDGSGDHVISATVETGPVLIEGLTIRNGRDGIHLYTGTITVTGNTVRDASRQGIEIEDGQILLQNNLITGIDREGIEVDGGTVTVRSNTIYTTGCHGILVQGGTTLIEGNVVCTVEENPHEEYHGIEISGTQMVSGNMISDIDHYGIYAYDGAPIVANNVIYDTSGDGIHIDDTGTDVEIHGNIVYDTARDGIDTRGQTNVVASNTVHDTDKDGIHVEDASTVHIQYNTIYDVDDDGIDVGGDIAFITSNSVDGCGESGIKSEEVHHTTINANQVYNTNQDNKVNKAGIDLDDAGTFTVTNNIVAGSRWASVLVETGAGPNNLLHHNTLIGSAAGQQGTAISITVTGITTTIVNNIIVSHSVSIIAIPDARLIVSHTLLWDNSDDPISGTSVLAETPLFVDPAGKDYHLRSDSPAVDAGEPVCVTTDVDGDRRPIGPLPDIGADEVRLKSFLPLVMRND